MFKLRICIISLFMLCFHINSYAGDVTVKWQNPDQFTDIDSGNQNKDAFQTKLFNNVDAIFADLAKKLPDGDRWEVTITDVKLAGQVTPSFTNFGNDVRIIKSSYPPGMNFQYKLFNAQNSLIREAKVNLTDLGFMSHLSTITESDSKPFPYEETMLRQWFDRQQNDKIFPSN